MPPPVHLPGLGVFVRRSALLGAVALGFAAPSCERHATIEALVTVEDVSESVEARRWGSLDEAPSSRVLVADGTRSLDDDPAAVAALPRARSRLADGLRAAGAALGTEPGVVRLRSDGRDTEGGVREAARALAVAGHRVFVEAPSPALADVALASVRVVEAAPDTPVAVLATLTSSVAGRVRVTLVRDGAERAFRVVDVTPSLPSTVRLMDVAGRRASDAFEVSLVPEEGTPDDDRANDRIRFEVAADVVRVVIAGEGAAAAVFSDGVRTTRVPTLDEVDLDAVDLLVTSSLPARVLSDERLERVTRFVAGGGVMLVLGGADAYGPGGVAGTAYERLLPLKPRREDGDGVACVVALDRSGSTGESTGAAPAAIEDLRRAVRALDRRLPDRTALFVLPFADRPDALLAIERRGAADDRARVDRRLGALAAILPGGGTNLPLAIEAAIEAAARVGDVRRRRVFLLTDGDPDHPADPRTFAPLRALLSRSGVEFSAIVRGDEAAATALRTLAARPDDVVRIDGASAFPEALVRTFERGRTPDEIEEGSFAPVATSEGADARAAAVPRPTRVHRLEARDDAVVWARVPGRDGTPLPVAAMRRFGAGQVVCFAGGPALEEGAARGAMLAALEPLCRRLARVADRGLAAEREGDRLRVEGAAGQGSLPVFVGDDPLAEPLLETTNGLYEGSLPPGTPIDALLRAGRPPRALRLPYAPAVEHRGAGADLETLRAIADSGLGRVLAPDEATPRRRGSSRRDLSPYCFGMAVLLLLLDRALARTSRPLRTGAEARA